MAGKLSAIIGVRMKRYVVGDIHGCYDELVTLLSQIVQDANGEPYKIIFVGDYIDRGPDSRRVIHMVRQRVVDNGDVALMGNHEDMFVGGEKLYAQATLRSYEGSFDLESDIWWMKKLPKYYEDDTIIVAHAGAKPGVPMDQQDDAMLMWYRYAVGQAGDMGKHLYHGHTPRIGAVENYPDRTNVDSGCVFDGHLTAAVVGDNGKPTGFIFVKSSYGKKETEWEE